MNTKITKTIEKMIENYIKEIKSSSKEERKRKKLYSKLLKLIKPMIIEMLQDGYEIKMINKIINNAYKIEINYITFFRWVKRNITEKEITKSNFKEEKNFRISIKEKEIKNETTEVKENKKTIDPRAIEEIMKNDILLEDEDYSKLL